MGKVSTPPTAMECAVLVFDTLPLIMRTIGSEMHRRHVAELTPVQFHTLMYISKHQGASLSDLAEIRGATLSSTSKMVDGLVERGLMTRETHADDRRRLVLAVTPAGASILEAMHDEGTEYLAELVSTLSADEWAHISKSMHLLRSVCMAANPPETAIPI